MDIKLCQIPATNFTYGRGGYSIKYVTPHHAMITSLAGLDATFLNPTRQASTHYGISGNEVHQYVSEGNTAWSNGNWESNCESITFEMCNTSTEPPYPISDETIDTAAKLTADILTRYGLGKAEYKKNITLHRDTSATNCPGDYFAVEYGIKKFCTLVNKYTKTEEVKIMAGEVITWDAHKGDNQLWRVTKGGLQNKATGKMLDVTGNSKEAGTQLCVWDAHGGANQQFSFVPTTVGYLIVNNGSALCVDAKGAGMQDGTPVIVWEKNDALNQHWFRVPVEDDWFMLLNANSGDALDAVM